MSGERAGGGLQPDALQSVHIPAAELTTCASESDSLHADRYSQPTSSSSLAPALPGSLGNGVCAHPLLIPVPPPVLDHLILHLDKCNNTQPPFLHPLIQNCRVSLQLHFNHIYRSLYYTSSNHLSNKAPTLWPDTKDLTQSEPSQPTSIFCGCTFPCGPHYSLTQNATHPH